MAIEYWSSAKDTAALYGELKQMDLLEHVAEIEAFGYTVLPPETVGPADQHEEAKEAVLRIACERKDCSRDELESVFSDGQELLVDYTYIPEPATLLLLGLGDLMLRRKK